MSGSATKAAAVVVALASLLATGGCTTIAHGPPTTGGAYSGGGPASAQASASEAGSGSSDPSSATTTDGESGTDSGGTGLARTTVGHAAKTSKLSVTLKKVTDPAPIESSSVFKPSAGKKWVVLSIDVTNLADKPLSFTPTFCMQAKTDANTEATASIIASYGTPLPSAAMQKGDTSSGDVVFEIPTDRKLKMLDVKCDLDFEGDQRTIRVDPLE